MLLTVEDATVLVILHNAAKTRVVCALISRKSCVAMSVWTYNKMYDTAESAETPAGTVVSV